MRVLVACEFSGEVRRAFRVRGHDAWSCDLLTAEDGEREFHLTDDVRWHLDPSWDMLIAFPPCTHLAVSGARWFKDKRDEQKEALAFVQALLDAPIDRVALENPIGVISTRIRPPDQIIQPWQFGHGETKATCLWLKNLPKLKPTNIVEGRTPRVHYASPGPDRWKERSRTLPGIAAAMAQQWSDTTTNPCYPSSSQNHGASPDMKHFILDHTGHSTIEFDPNNTIDTDAAMARFDELVGEKKFTAATRKKGETEYTKVKSFKETQDETLFIPALQGG